MKNAILISLVCLTIFSTSSHKKILVHSNYLNHHNLIDTSRYAILKYDKERDKYHGFDKASKATALSFTDLIKLENAINKKVTEYNEAEKKGKFHRIIRHPEKYYKQLIAVINSKGEKEVWASCSCSVYDKSSWKKEIMIVEDGGSCYFQIKINLTKNTDSDFRVNGEA